MAAALPTEADYVVVGGGSAGCAVAGRLAAAGKDVILIEAGPTDRKGIQKLLVNTPGMIGPMHAEPSLKKTVDWGFHTVPQTHALDRVLHQPRGKVLGGSSSINGVIWVRGHRGNYEAWAAEGNAGWDADSVNKVYQRLEDFEGGADGYRGAGGPIKVTRHTQPTEASTVWRDAASNALGVKIIDDYNGAENEGVSAMQQSASNGQRYSASYGYLHSGVLPTKTLTTLTGLQATKVVIENGRAVGVEVQDSAGARHVIRAGREVVLSAGFAGSPQLLMLSGVGHADHLTEHNIPVIADLPVGDNLHDHMFIPMTFLVPSNPHRGTAWYFGKGMLKQFTVGHSFLESTVFESVGFVRTSQATDVPDMQFHVLPWSYAHPNQDGEGRLPVDARPALTVFSTLIHPRSRGTLRLRNADPFAEPLIDFNYLAEKADRQVLLEGIEQIRAIMADKAISGLVESELEPGSAIGGAGSAASEREILNRATSVYHGVGSCRMGIDERAVVDPQLRVRGIEGLRVADASIMPSIIGGNTNAPSIMIGDKAAELILSA